MDINQTQNVVYEQPRSQSRRNEIAGRCCTELKLSMPCVVDTMDNAVDEAFAGWPERLFVVGADGRIAYAGGPGPFGFNVEDVERWLQKHTR